MTKIKKFLEKQGYSIEYIETCLMQGPKSFTNDGTYREERYSVTKGSEKYNLTNKITGKHLYMMYDDDDVLIAGGESQVHFIGYMERHIHTLRGVEVVK